MMNDPWILREPWCYLPLVLMVLSAALRAFAIWARRKSRE